MQYAVLFLLLGSLMACGTEAEQASAFISGAIPVTISQVQVDSMQEKVETTGLVTTDQTTTYAFKIGGVISKVYVDEGDRIRKGDLLASLSLTEIDAQLAQARLGLAKAQRDYERVQNLYRDSIATLEVFQDAKTQLDVAQATVDQVAFNRKYAKIYATSSGFVARKIANTGEIAGPGTPVLVTNDASADQGWRMDCKLSAADWALVKVGDASSVSLDAYPNQPLSGRVATKALQAEPVSGAFRVELQLLPGKSELAVGMYGTAHIQTSRQRKLLSIPFEALVEANGKEGFVFIPNTDSTVVRKKISIASYDAQRVYVASGLAVDERIVLSNSAFLNESTPIKIVD